VTCETDAEALETAGEAYGALNDGAFPADDAALVPDFIKAESDMNEIDNTGAVTPEGVGVP